jgi:hypothetical protein
MTRLGSIQIMDGQITVAAAARHIANRVGKYSEDDHLLLPKAEGEAVSILNSKWLELEIERANLILARTVRRELRRAQRKRRRSV